MQDAFIKQDGEEGDRAMHEGREAMKTTCVDRAEDNGVTDRVEMAEAFYMDIVVALGEAPGQRDSFDSLLDYLEPEDPGEIWHAGMVGFGLALAGDDESRRFVEDAAAVFLIM